MVYAFDFVWSCPALSSLHLVRGLLADYKYVYAKLFLERPPFAFQKAVNCTPKGHLLPCKRWPFARCLIIRRLQLAV